MLKHNSIRPDRSDVIGEIVFSAHWRVLMDRVSGWESDGTVLSGLLRDTRREPDQRDATVAATIIQWLGTGVGTCWRSEAARQAGGTSIGYYRSRAYLSHWATQNHRQCGLNYGLRTLELLMIEPDLKFKHIGHVLIGPIPDLSIHDYETADHIVYWLGSNEGQRFLELAETEIKLRLDQDRATRLGMTRPAPPPDSGGLAKKGI